MFLVIKVNLDKKSIARVLRKILIKKYCSFNSRIRIFLLLL